MKVLTILGTRPEIIRLSLIIPKLDKACHHILLHTGQNPQQSLNDIFFEQLKVRKPDYFLDVRSNSFAEQIGKILTEGEKVLVKEKPDRVVILGDTNSGILSLVAKRLGIEVYHLEAGNRCYDDRVPEEVNRRVIDHTSTVLMPYTESSRQNLIREGIEGQRIFVIGNPIYEVINHFRPRINRETVFQKYKVSKKKFFLLTAHRAENVDHRQRLEDLFITIDKLQREYAMPVICSFHPRTEDKFRKFGLSNSNPNIFLLEPLSFFDFIALEENAFCVLTDSGTVQEECCIFKVPNLTIRDVTERPETIACGSNILTGIDKGRILSAVKLIVEKDCFWQPPAEYLAPCVSDTAVNIITGYRKL